MNRYLVTIAVALLVLAVVIPLKTRAQAPAGEYRSQISCYIQGVANPGGAESGTTKAMNERAREGWHPIAVSAYNPGGSGACILLIFKRS